MSVDVNVRNFATIETAIQFGRTIGIAGGVDRFFRLRQPTRVDQQPVIRMQRDTLYAAAVVDISEGAAVVIPDAGDRYLSAAVVNGDHYTNAIFHKAGTHQLSMDRFDTPYVQVVVRILVDPTDPEDIATVHALQDKLAIVSGAGRPFVAPEYDQERYEGLYQALLAVGSYLPDSVGAFGSRESVEPVSFLVNTAQGWGGLPETEAIYFTETTPRSVGHYQLRLADVPADAFWSISVYNRDGYFEANPFDSYNLNSVFATAEDDGSYVVDFAPEDRGYHNFLYVMDGWNYVLRLYRPHPEVISGDWPVPKEQHLETV